MPVGGVAMLVGDRDDDIDLQYGVDKEKERNDVVAKK